jgi:hypothetical protein
VANRVILAIGVYGLKVIYFLYRSSSLLKLKIGKETKVNTIEWINEPFVNKVASALVIHHHDIPGPPTPVRNWYSSET